jgi:6-phosphogluconolactonase
VVGHELEVLPDARAAARRGAELIAESAAEAIAARGGFSLAASGGTEPWEMYRLLADFEVDWDHVDVFQVDERMAPDGDPDRNLTHLRETLPEPACGRLRPMPVNAEHLDDATAEYAAQLPDRIDLIHLGIGPDGHTASLMPGDAVLEVTDRRVALTAGEYEGRRRMTLTYPELSRSRRVFWLITGEEKREPLGWLLASDHSIPAGRVHAEDSLVLTDEAAAGNRSDRR